MQSPATRRSFAAPLAAAIVALLAPPVAAAATTLRVCTDPDNLPFSKSDGPERGVYVELAERVGRRIDATVEYVWWLSFNQRKALRNTIQQDDCDAYFVLPANADYRARGLDKTRPFLDLSYALVAPASRQFAALADLKGLRIGVLHGTPPHILLARHEGYATSSFKEQGEAFDALARGEIDAALLWGPSAGYENMKRFGKRWRVTPVRGEGLGGQVAVAVRSDHQPLLAAIHKALADLAPEIAALADKYGFPRGQDAWKETALQTIVNGRPEAGMPAWKDVLKREEIEAVLDLLATIQK
jgi:mxaJ protein